MNNSTEIIVPVLKKYGVQKASLFGSYARGSQDEQSDIDILIEPPSGMGIQIVHLKRELEKSLNKKVDLVSYNGISRYLKKYILANQIPLL
jgi:predicted nucleotidyltransferase